MKGLVHPRTCVTHSKGGRKFKVLKYIEELMAPLLLSTR